MKKIKNFSFFCLTKGFFKCIIQVINYSNIHLIILLIWKRGHLKGLCLKAKGGEVMKRFYLFLSILLAFCLSIDFTFKDNQISLSSLEAEAASSIVLSTGWEDGENLGLSDRIEYSYNVAGYYNSNNPPPKCSRG